MSDAARYRQKAREFEQRESWKRAIEAYELAIESDNLAQKGDDLALFNRIGDLYRRVGDVNKAVEYYEMAADGHLSAGYYNNAIALCNKILRNQPNRHSAYLKLGKIGAAKGFLSDARKHFLEYAERMQKSGELDQAFSALIEFASLSPDPEVRLMIADQLIEHDRTKMAVDQLRLAWLNLSDEGREADADEVRRRILDLDPDRDPEVDRPKDSAVAGIDAVGIIDLPELLPYGEPERRAAKVEVLAEPEPDLEQGSAVLAEEDTEASAPELEALDLEPPGYETAEPVDVDSEGLDLEALEVPDLEVSEEGSSIDILPTELDEEAKSAAVGEGNDRGGQDLEILPTTLVGEQGGKEEEEEESVAVAEVHVEEVPVEVLEEVDEPAFEPEGAAEPAAVAEKEVAAEAATPAGRVAEIEMRIAAEGRHPDLLVDLAEALLETGGRAKSLSLLEEAVEIHEVHGRFRDAGRVLDELIRLDVNDVKSYQKRIAVAFRADDQHGLVDAYLGLADCLDRTDATNKARAIYSRVLELDPQNQRAAAALEMFGEDEPEPPTAPTGQPAAEPASEDFIDLGALVAEELDEKSTRFIVPTSDPQSEADVNFGEMLDQFKSKIAEAIEKEDASSHYDLGCAFKDMGLLDEAIAEFQIAARSTDFRLRAIEMLGTCFMEKEDYRIGLKVLSRALQVPGYTDEELIGILYFIGRAYEALGERKTALEWYERVLGCDLHFRDASERVSAMRQ
jgi:tetratricopeptide (TPR) repeat protein